MTLLKCPKCLPKEGIKLPELSLDQKKKIAEIKQKSNLNAVSWLRDNLKLSLRDSKFIVSHLGSSSKCNKCSYVNLSEEIMNCPKCGALNINWIEE